MSLLIATRSVSSENSESSPYTIIKALMIWQVDLVNLLVGVYISVQIRPCIVKLHQLPVLGGITDRQGQALQRKPTTATK